MPKASKRSKSSSKDRSKKDKSEKSKSSRKEDVVEEVVEEVPVQQPVVEKKKKKEPVPTPDAADAADAADATETTEVEVGKRQRRVVTKESVLEEFDQLLKDVEAEIEALRNPDSKKTKSKGVKFMRAVGKRIKCLRNDSSRVMRTRKQSTRPKNTTSGFMKPVQISPEMAKFTGWEPDVPRSRVDVTKYLCQYIRENNLQNPEDRRIIRPDNQLKSLLNLQGQDSEKTPLTYYSLQKSIQHHFTNDTKTTA
jgi:chromatin remodeling complex protein RSC6